MKQSDRIALVIENDDYIETSVQGYLNDNPDLFDRVVEVTYAKYRMEDVNFALNKEGVTDIVASSTFMYKDQIETIAMLLHAKDKPYTIHLEYACQKMNAFIETKDGKLENERFWDSLDIMQVLSKKWVQEGRIYEINQDDVETVPTDKYTPRFWPKDRESRPKYIGKKLRYSEEYNVFYLEGEDPENKVRWVHRTEDSN